ncbi:IAP [Carcinus maenas nudivirus]|uniref:IAP n=1 Tax=Carcinus maenas nudivirus TaxID=2880837 RepID=A0AAE9BZD4_9VIRU|nr:IAP [Carcinus maenas nudivirus]UBZ25648.1 IAP [Carcinus maenas nudivirus]
MAASGSNEGVYTRPVYNKRKLLSANNLVFKEIRLATFKNWPAEHIIGAESLAEAGFIYTKKEDHCMCIYCEIEIGFWERGDKAFGEHKTHSSQCRFLQNKMTNIDKDCFELRDYLVNMIENGPPIKFPVDNACFKNMDVRAVSMFNYPVALQNQQEMAKAGFYSVYHDITRCYACGGYTFNWEKNDDPFKVHRELFPSCVLSKTEGDVVETKPYVNPVDLHYTMFMNLNILKDFKIIQLEKKHYKAICQKFKETCILPINAANVLTILDEYNVLDQ